MALLQTWRDTAYSQDMDKNTAQRFWGTYFELEKNFYAELLSNPDEEVTGTVKELAEIMGSSHQNVKQILLKLEKKGVVYITADERDKRKQQKKSGSTANRTNREAVLPFLHD